MGWIDKVLKKNKVFSGNTQVVSEEQAALDPYPTKARIVAPNSPEGEEFVETLTASDRCGECVHFNFGAGQQRLHDRNMMILPRLLKEFDLQTLGGHLNDKEIGLCEQWTSSHQEPALVSATSPTTVPKWYLDASTPRPDRDKSAPCPYYRLRPTGWRKLFMKGDK